MLPLPVTNDSFEKQTPRRLSLQHEKEVTCGCFHPNKEIIVTTSVDGFLRLYGKPNYKHLATFDENLESTTQQRYKTPLRFCAISSAIGSAEDSAGGGGMIHRAFDIGTAAVGDLLVATDVMGRLFCYNIADPSSPVFYGAKTVVASGGMNENSNANAQNQDGPPVYSSRRTVHFVAFTGGVSTCSLLCIDGDGRCTFYGYSPPSMLRDNDGALLPQPLPKEEYPGLRKSDTLIPLRVPFKPYFPSFNTQSSSSSSSSSPPHSLTRAPPSQTVLPSSSSDSSAPPLLTYPRALLHGLQCLSTFIHAIPSHTPPDSYPNIRLITNSNCLEILSYLKSSPDKEVQNQCVQLIDTILTAMEDQQSYTPTRE